MHCYLQIKKIPKKTQTIEIDGSKFTVFNKIEKIFCIGLSRCLLCVMEHRDKVRPVIGQGNGY